VSSKSGGLKAPFLDQRAAFVPQERDYGVAFFAERKMEARGLAPAHPKGAALPL
jgi:hypothetical protein